MYIEYSSVWQNQKKNTEIVIWQRVDRAHASTARLRDDEVLRIKPPLRSDTIALHRVRHEQPADDVWRISLLVRNARYDDDDTDADAFRCQIHTYGEIHEHTLS